MLSRLIACAVCVGLLCVAWVMGAGFISHIDQTGIGYLAAVLEMLVAVTSVGMGALLMLGIGIHEAVGRQARRTTEKVEALKRPSGTGPEPSFGDKLQSFLTGIPLQAQPSTKQPAANQSGKAPAVDGPHARSWSSIKHTPPPDA